LSASAEAALALAAAEAVVRDLHAMEFGRGVIVDALLVGGWSLVLVGGWFLFEIVLARLACLFFAFDCRAAKVMREECKQSTSVCQRGKDGIEQVQSVVVC
jgi:hypothetical protein